MKFDKANYAAIHASGFRDFLLKPELLRATVECGFEHPSEVQHACMPQAIFGTELLELNGASLKGTSRIILGLVFVEILDPPEVDAKRHNA